MDLRLLADKVVRKLRRDGPVTALRHGLAALRRRDNDTAFDRAHGTDTAGIEPLWKLTIAGGNARHGNRYQAVDAATVERAVALLGIRPQDFTFVDLGTGKGRPLLVAAGLGFRAVIGVEFAAELAATATANLARLGIAHGHVLTLDAAEYAFPPGDLVVFFYNSFGPEVLGRVLANLAHAAGPRVFFLYVRPDHAATVASSGVLERLDTGADPLIQAWRRP